MESEPVLLGGVGGWLCSLSGRDTYCFEVSEWLWSSDLITMHDVLVSSSTYGYYQFTRLAGAPLEYCGSLKALLSQGEPN